MVAMNKLPNLIIGGVNKAGTTSLHTYLSWHPAICGSIIKETNYFVPLLYNKELPPIDKYMEYFRDCNSQNKYLMESTPRYIYGGEKIAKRIYEQLGMIKVIFLLRDPIQRLFSYYRHMKDNGEVSQNVLFDAYVGKATKDFSVLTKGKIHKYINVYEENVYIRGLAQGFYCDYLTGWYNIFGDSIKIYHFEGLKNNPIQLMKQICNWLEIDSSIYESATFSIENKRINYRSKRIHKILLSINDKFESFFRTHYYLKNSLRSMYYLFNESKSKKEIISDSILKQLELLYEPYNKQLVRLLCSKGYSDYPNWLDKYS